MQTSVAYACLQEAAYEIRIIRPLGSALPAYKIKGNPAGEGNGWDVRGDCSMRDGKGKKGFELLFIN